MSKFEQLRAEFVADKREALGRELFPDEHLKAWNDGAEHAAKQVKGEFDDFFKAVAEALKTGRASVKAAKWDDANKSATAIADAAAEFLTPVKAPSKSNFTEQRHNVEADTSVRIGHAKVSKMRRTKNMRLACVFSQSNNCAIVHDEALLAGTGYDAIKAQLADCDYDAEGNAVDKTVSIPNGQWFRVKFDRRNETTAKWSHLVAVTEKGLSKNR